MNGVNQGNGMYLAISLGMLCQQLKQEEEKEIGWEQMIIVLHFVSGNLCPIVAGNI